MKRKTIAVDIDDVLSVNVPAFIDFSNQKWGTSLTIDDFHEDWASMWKISHEAVVDRIRHMDDVQLFRKFEHIEEAVPVLKKLSQKYNLVIATSRRKTLITDTNEWIDQHFPNIFSGVHYAGIWDDATKRMGAHLKTKADLVRQIGADYLVDDYPKHCSAAAQVGIQTVLFGDYPWNRDVVASPGVARARNWHEVEGYFDGQ